MCQKQRILMCGQSGRRDVLQADFSQYNFLCADNTVTNYLSYLYKQHTRVFKLLPASQVKFEK